MKVDIREYTLIDNHCHPFLKEKETSTFEQYWTLSVLDIPPEQLKNTLLYRMVIRELGRLFDLEDADETEIIAHRNKLYDGNPREYMTTLFNDARIETVLLDVGYPSKEFGSYSVDINEFSKFIPAKNRTIIRIEPIIFRLLSEKRSFSDFSEAFCKTLEEEIVMHKAVAIKTVIAYLTGLEVQRVDKEEAIRAYETFLKDTTNRGAEKVVRDYLVNLTLNTCLKHKLPLQIHTGVGDSPIIDLRLSNPLLMYNIISAEEYRDVQIVLVHCGYPYAAEAGFLANNYPGVWVDLSEMVPFASIGCEPKLLELMEMAPTNKILYGSDGYNIPELFWFSGVYFCRCLERVLNKLIAEHVISLKYAQQVAAMILSENSKVLYRL